MGYKCYDPSDPNAQWAYCPSFGAAIFFAIVFGTITLTHITQAFLYRKAYCWVLIMGAIWETGGLVSRVVSVTMENKSGPAFVSQLLVLLAPLWINAFSYMTLGRIMYFLLPDISIWHIKPQRLTSLFVILDIVTFFVQVVGASQTSNDNSIATQERGLHIYMGGVGLQQLLILLFTILAVRFHVEVNRRYTNTHTPASFSQQNVPHNPLRTLRTAKFLLATLYTVLGLISVRIIFRLCEFSSGVNGYLPDHEWPSYLFDFTMMSIALIVLAVFHPGRFIQGEGSMWVKLTRREKKAIKREKKDAKRAEKAARKNGNGTAGRWGFKASPAVSSDAEMV